MIITLIISKFLLKQFQRESIWGGCFLILLFWNSEPPYIQIVYQSFISENLLICKLVHTSGDNKKLK